MLDDALRSNDQTESVARLTVAIAHRAGAQRPRPAALAAIVAACRYLRRPHVHATPAHAATTCGCNVRTCEQWVDRIEACLLAEASTEAAATAAPTEPGSSTSQAGEASVACSPDEINAIGGLVSLGDGQHRAGPPTDGPPPTLPPSPPSATALPGTATPRTPTRARGAYMGSILARQGNPAHEHRAQRAAPTEYESAILQMALRTISDELLAQLAPDMDGEEPSDGNLSLEEVRELLKTETPRGRHAPAPHHQGSAQRGHPRREGSYEPPRETLDDGARGQSSSWDEFRAAIDTTWEDFTAAHATARGTHNPSMIGDMPNAQDAAAASPAPFLCARRPPPAPKAFAALGTPVPPQRTSPRLARQGTAAPAAPSPPLALAGAAPRMPARIPTAGSVHHAYAIDEAIEQLTRRSSPRRPHAALSTEAIDQAIAAHPRVRARSPQPATAAEARRLAAHDIAHRLTTHESQYALCPDRPGLLHGIIIDAAEARDAGIPNGTADSDEWGFKWVKRFAEATENPWMRPRAVSTSTDVLCEVWFAILALVWIAQMIAPSARRRRAGYGQGMPTSALLALYGWRRVMRDCGRYTPDLTEVRGVLKGICARYKVRWGDEAFVPNRKQPFSSRHMLEIVALLTKPATTLTAWSDVLRMGPRSRRARPWGQLQVGPRAWCRRTRRACPWPCRRSRRSAGPPCVRRCAWPRGSSIEPVIG